MKRFLIHTITMTPIKAVRIRLGKNSIARMVPIASEEILPAIAGVIPFIPDSESCPVLYTFQRIYEIYSYRWMFRDIHAYQHPASRQSCEARIQEVFLSRAIWAVMWNNP